VMHLKLILHLQIFCVSGGQAAEQAAEMAGWEHREGLLDDRTQHGHEAHW